MSGSVAMRFAPTGKLHGGSQGGWVKGVFIGVTVLFIGLFLFVPLISIFVEAFRNGARAYFNALTLKDSIHSMQMTLVVAACVVPLNAVFGIVAAWAVAKFNFVGKSLLTTVIDLPFAVSPVISGMIFVLIFGPQGWARPYVQPWLEAVHFSYPWLYMEKWGDVATWHWGWAKQDGVKIIFGIPGMVMATCFVTFPFVARELIPLMQEQGTQEEQAAISLGASGFQTFWRVTLPNIKWGLLYGIILCNARAMGDFGAVSVVTANQPGETNTMPREIANLFDGFNIPGSFALASMLAGLGLVTLVAKSLLEWKIKKDQVEGSEGE